MAANPQLPRPQNALIDSRDWPTTEWYEYWRNLLLFVQENTGNAADIAALQAQIDAIEAGLNGGIVGLNSVIVSGSLTTGGVQITLAGDSQAPGNTYYYGTGPTGVKGFFPVSDAVDGADSIIKTVGVDGVSTFNLDGDDPAPGNNTYYGTDGAGVKGFHMFSGGGVLSVTGADSVDVDNTDPANPVVSLVNDVASPAAMNGYGTDSAGVRGWYRPALFESTGVIDGCALSFNPTTFNIASGVLGFTDWSITPTQPTRVILPFAGASNVATTGLTTAVATYVGINSAGTVVQQTTPFTNTQRRTIAQLGAIIHSNLTTNNAVNDQAATIRSGINQAQDIIRALGILNLDGGLVFSSNGVGLQIQRTAGKLFGLGFNFQTNHNDPHVVALGATNPQTFRYRTQTGVETGDITAINPNSYDVGGVVTAIPILGNQWHVQRINVFQSGLVRIQYGQVLYPSASAAIDAIVTGPFVTEPNIAENGCLRCFLVINRGLLGLLGSATFVDVSKFGAAGTGGGGVTSAAIISALGYTPADEATIHPRIMARMGMKL